MPRAGWWLLAVFLCLGLYVESYAFVKRELTRQGMAPVALGEVSVSPGRVELRDISLADGVVSIGRLSVTASLTSLRQGRVSAIEIDQPQVKASFKGGKLSLGTLDPLLSGRGGKDGGELPFETLSVNGATLVLAGHTVLTVSARHAGRSGSATLSTPPLVFEENGLQPARFYPPLAALSAVSGMVAVHGNLVWRDGTLTPDLDLLLERFSATLGSVTVRRASAVVKLTQVWPPLTPADQILAVAAIDAGLPLTEALVHFRLDGQGNLMIRDAVMGVARGRVHLADASLPLDGGPADLALSVEAIDLGEIARIVDLGGLSADGALSGQVPVRIEGGEVLIRKAHLESSAPGILRYRSAQPSSALHAPEQGISLLLQALADFHYKELRVDLDGRTNGDMTVGLHILGSNPTVYDGAPIAFNLSIAGPLTQVVRQGLENYRVPDPVRAQMMTFGKAHKEKPTGKH